MFHNAPATANADGASCTLSNLYIHHKVNLNLKLWLITIRANILRKNTLKLVLKSQSAKKLFRSDYEFFFKNLANGINVLQNFKHSVTHYCKTFYNNQKNIKSQLFGDFFFFFFMQTVDKFSQVSAINCKNKFGNLLCCQLCEKLEKLVIGHNYKSKLILL